MLAVFELESSDDERLAPYRGLRSRAGRNEATFIVEGAHLVERLVSSSLDVVSVLVSSRKADRFSPDLPTSIPVFVLHDAEIERLVGFRFHRGVLGYGLRPAEQGFDSLFGGIEGGLKAVACPEISDAENLGSIMRTARCLGLNALILGERSTDAYSRRCIRVSMGAAFSLPVYRCASFADDLEKLVARPGVQVVAAVADDGASPLSSVSPGSDWCVVLGNEEDGLEENLLKLCHESVLIPMAKDADSLNVSVAAGIILHHMTSDP